MTSKDHYVKSSQEQWASLVRLAFECQDVSELAREAGANKATLKRKFQAIRWAVESGMSREEIVSQGQGFILSIYARAYRNGNGEKHKILRWRVSASLADAVMWSEGSDSTDEALITRLKRVCKLETSDDLFEFLLSIFADLSDKELKNLAGVEHEKKRKATAPEVPSRGELDNSERRSV
jgi:hypothetical protein